MPVLRYRDPETGAIKTVGAPIDELTAQNHIDNKNNPHEVTAEQVGAAPAEHDHDDKYATLEDLAGAGIPITSEPDEGVTTWIDPGEDNDDDDWYTKGEVDALLVGKSNVDHDHTGVYARTSMYSATFVAGGWSSEAPYTQTVTVDGILGSDNPFVDIILSGVETEEESAAIMESWCMVGRITTANGSVTATCFSEVPTVNISIQLKVVR